MDWLTSIGAGVGSGVAVFGLLQFSVKRAIEQQFRRRENREQSRLELELEAARHELERQLAIFPALDQLVYRAKVAADAVRGADSLASLTDPDLVDCCRELTVRLTGYRVYLDEPTFELVHEFKHALQDLVLLGDVATRPERIRSSASLEIPSELAEPLRSLHLRVEELSSRIGERLKAKMQSLRGTL